MMKKTNLEDMKEQNNNRPHIVVLMYLSWFGAGRAPKAPGTFGTLAALPFIYAWSLLSFSHTDNILLIAFMTVLACFAADHVQKKLSLHDPQWIVVDEVIGMLITWSFVRNIEFPTLFLVFSLFRLFDIVKIFRFIGGIW